MHLHMHIPLSSVSGHPSIEAPPFTQDSPLDQTCASLCIQVAPCHQIRDWILMSAPPEPVRANCRRRGLLGLHIHTHEHHSECAHMTRMSMLAACQCSMQPCGANQLWCQLPSYPLPAKQVRPLQPRRNRNPGAPPANGSNGCPPASVPCSLVAPTPGRDGGADLTGASLA